MKKIVVFTGAGVSADSGLATFRDADGLWASYRIEDVCMPEALRNNRATVIEFYNKRRRELLEKQPNAAHYAIAELEKHFDVDVITQNVDNFHERAGSTRVTHLHGELMKLRSSVDPDLIVPIEGWEQKPDAKAPDGSLLRPHIVFLGSRCRCSTRRRALLPQPTFSSLWGRRLRSILRLRWCITYVPTCRSIWSTREHPTCRLSAIR